MTTDQARPIVGICELAETIIHHITGKRWGFLEEVAGVFHGPGNLDENVHVCDSLPMTLYEAAV